MNEPEAGMEQMAPPGVDRIRVPAPFFGGTGGLEKIAPVAERVVPLARQMS